MDPKMIFRPRLRYTSPSARVNSAESICSSLSWPVFRGMKCPEHLGMFQRAHLLPSCPDWGHTTEGVQFSHKKNLFLSSLAHHLLSVLSPLAVPPCSQHTKTQTALVKRPEHNKMSVPPTQHKVTTTAGTKPILAATAIYVSLHICVPAAVTVIPSLKNHWSKFQPSISGTFDAQSTHLPQIISNNPRATHNDFPPHSAMTVWSPLALPPKRLPPRIAQVHTAGICFSHFYHLLFALMLRNAFIIELWIFLCLFGIVEWRSGHPRSGRK